MHTAKWVRVVTNSGTKAIVVTRDDGKEFFGVINAPIGTEIKAEDKAALIVGVEAALLTALTYADMNEVLPASVLSELQKNARPTAE